jgi:hypothetical protein
VPFKSSAQRRFMYSQHPEIAARWRKESGPQRGLPERANRKRHSDRRQRLVEHFVSKQRGR